MKTTAQTFFDRHKTPHRRFADGEISYGILEDAIAGLWNEIREANLDREVNDLIIADMNDAKNRARKIARRVYGA